MGEHLEYIQKQTRQHKNPSSVQDKQLQKVKKYQIIQKKTLVKKLY